MRVTFDRAMLVFALLFALEISWSHLMLLAFALAELGALLNARAVGWEAVARNDELHVA